MVLLLLAGPPGPARPAYVSGNSVGSIPGSSLTPSVTVSAPASIVPGNLLVAVLGNSKADSTGNTYAPSAPSGWTLLTSYASPTDGMVAVWTKVATASEPTTYTFGYAITGAAATSYLSMAVLQYANAQIAGPFATASSNGTATTSYTAPSVTSTISGGSYISAWVQQQGNSLITPPGSMTSRQQVYNFSNYSMDVADAGYNAAGASGSFVATGSSDRFAAVTFELIPQQQGAYVATPAFSGSGTLGAIGSGGGTPGFTAQYSQNWDTGSSGTAITTANTTGTGETPIASTAVNNGATLTFDNSVSHSGAYSLHVNHAGVASAAYAVMNTSVAIGTRAAFREYFYFPAGYNFANTLNYSEFRDSGSVALAYLGHSVSASNWFIGTNYTNGVQVTFTPSAQVWYRIEGAVTTSATAGAAVLEIAIYAGDSTTPIVSNIRTGATLTNTNAISTTRLGWAAATDTQDHWRDDWALDTTLAQGSFIGPTVLPDQAITGTASLSASGTLSALNVPSIGGLASFSGSGTLGPIAAAPQSAVPVVLAGAGALSTGSSSASVSVNPQFAGTGVLTSAATPNAPGIPALSGAGVLSAGAGIPAPRQAVALSGTGALAVGAGSLNFTGVAAFTGSGALAAVGSPSTPRSSSFSAVGVLAASAVPVVTTAKSFTTTGTLATTAAPSVQGAPAFTAAGTLAITAYRPSIPTTVALSGRGTLALGAAAALPAADVFRWRASQMSPQADGSIVTSITFEDSGIILTPDPGREPTYKASGLNGKSAVRFSPSNNSFLQTVSALTHYNQPLTVAVVMNFNSVTGQQQVFHLGGAELIVETSYETWNGALNTGTVAPVTGPQVLVTDMSGGNSIIWKNGDIVTPSGFTSTGGITDFVLGNHISAPRPLDGDIYEVLVWNRSLSAAERAGLDSYVQQTYGIVSSDATSGPVPAVTKAAAFTGQGTLSAVGTAVATAVGAANLSGSGSLATGAPSGSVASSVALSGQGVLSCLTSTTITLPYTETFSQPDGSPWPGVWTSAQNRIASIQGNKGRISSGNGGYAVSLEMLNGIAPMGDSEISGTFTALDSGVEQYITVTLNGDGTTDGGAWTDHTGYALFVYFDPSGAGAINISRFDGGAETHIVNDTNVPGGVQGQVPYRFRFQRIALHIRAKVWPAGSAEPDWQVSGTLASTPLVGMPALAVSNGGDGYSRSIDFDDVTVSRPVIDLPYTETFPGWDGAPWPEAWTVRTGTATIQGGQGQLVPTTASFGSSRADLTSMSLPMADTEVTGTLTMPTDGEQYPAVGINADYAGLSWSASNAYIFYVDRVSQEVVLSVVTAGDENDVVNVNNPAIATNAPLNFRFRRVGQVLSGRAWAAGSTEPTLWDVTYTIPGTPFVGGVTLTAQKGADPSPALAPPLLFDNVTIGVPTYGTTVAFSGTGSLTAVGWPAVPAAPTVSLSGSGSLGILVGPPALSAAANFTASGTLVATGSPSVARSAAFSGTGSLAASGSVTTSGSVALGGSGALASVSSPSIPRTVTFSATGALNALGAPKVNGSASLAGAGALSAIGSIASSGPASFSGAGVLNASGAITALVTTALGATGTLALTRTFSITSSPNFSANGVLAASAAESFSVPVALSGVGTLASGASGSGFSSANLSGSGALTIASTIPAIQQAVNLTGAGVLSAAVIGSFSTAAVFSGAGLLSASNTVAASGPANFTTSGTLLTASSGSSSALAVFSGIGSLAASKSVAVPVSVNLGGSGVLSASSAVVGVGTPALSGAGSLLVAPTSSAFGSAAFSASGQLGASGVAGATIIVAFSANGSLAVSASASIARTLAFSATGSLRTTAFPAAASSVAFSASAVLAALTSTGRTEVPTFSATGQLGVITATVYRMSATFSAVVLLMIGASSTVEPMVAFSGMGELGTAPSVATLGDSSLGGQGTLTTQSTVGAGTLVQFSASGRLAAAGIAQIYRRSSLKIINVRNEPLSVSATDGRFGILNVVNKSLITPGAPKTLSGTARGNPFSARTD